MREEQFTTRGAESSQELFYIFGYQYLRHLPGRALQVKLHHIALLGTLFFLSFFLNENHTLSLIFLLGLYGVLTFTQIVTSEKQYYSAAFIFVLLVTVEQILDGTVFDILENPTSNIVPFLIYLGFILLLLFTILLDSPYLSYGVAQNKVVEPSSKQAIVQYENFKNRIEDTEYKLDSFSNIDLTTYSNQIKTSVQIILFFSVVLFLLNSIFWGLLTFFQSPGDVKEQYFIATLSFFEFLLLVIVVFSLISNKENS